jgi:hypothetical protein
MPTIAPIQTDIAQYVEAAANLPPEKLKALMPPLAADWVDLMGVTATLLLIRAYPGLQMKVPVGEKDLKTKRRLIDLLGEPAALAFINQHGGEHLTVPMCMRLWLALRDAGIVAAYGQGVKVVELCATHWLAERQIRKILGTPHPFETP